MSLSRASNIMTESESVEGIQKQVEHLKEWITAEPHLPKDMDDKLLRRFLHSCYYDTERTRKTIENFTTFRSMSPELFGNRDLNSPQFQKALKIVKFGNVKAPGNKAIWLNQLNDPGLQNFDYLQDARLFLLAADAWLLEDESLAESDVVIMDMKDISFRIFTKISLSIARKLVSYQEEAMPMRLRQIHLLNVPSFIDKLFSLMRHFLKQDMTEMIHFHVANSDTLYKYISRDELPKEFGGNLESLDEIREKAIERLYKYRDTLCKDTLWKTPEIISKKNTKISALSSPGPRQTEDLPFRSLAID